MNRRACSRLEPQRKSARRKLGRSEVARVSVGTELEAASYRSRVNILSLRISQSSPPRRTTLSRAPSKSPTPHHIGVSLWGLGPPKESAPTSLSATRCLADRDTFTPAIA